MRVPAALNSASPQLLKPLFLSLQLWKGQLYQCQEVGTMASSHARQGRMQRSFAKPKHHEISLHLSHSLSLSPSLTLLVGFFFSSFGCPCLSSPSVFLVCQRATLPSKCSAATSAPQCAIRQSSDQSTNRSLHVSYCEVQETVDP